MRSTWEYFCEELSRFRKIIGLETYTPEQWDNAWQGLLCVYMYGDFGERTEDAITAINAAEIDYNRRVQYRLGLG